VIDHLLDLEERGWQALSSVESIAFCDEWLADDAVVIVPGMDIDRATFLEAVARARTTVGKPSLRRTTRRPAV
jgi:ketosteroid isomerase-like protein